MGQTKKMQRYDFNFFDTPTAREKSDSIKWTRYGKGVIPLWIADMDFRSCDEIIEALTARAQQGCFGYANDATSAIEAMIAYHKAQYGWEIDPDWVVPQPGVVTALSMFYDYIKATSYHPGVMINRPVYHHFMMSADLLQINKTFVDLNPFAPHLPDLSKIDALPCGGWILCNPQNPLGHAWTKEELETILAFAKDHNLLLASDEIHGGLVLDTPKTYTPTLTVTAPDFRENVMTFVAPSKTFNVPGLGCSFAIIPNPKIRAFFQQYYGQLIPNVNLFGWVGAEAAYRYAEPWRQGMLAYLRNNREMLYRFTSRWQLPVCKLEATYLAFINCASLLPGLKGENLQDFFLRHGVAVHDGEIFGAPGWIRINIATQRDLLQQAFDRMSEAIDSLHLPTL